MSTDLYIVKGGRLKAFLEDDEGDEIVLAEFVKGDFFGELSLLDGKGRSATIVAEEDAELFMLNKDVFLDTLAKNPKIAIEVISTLVERLRKADEMIESLAFREVGERLLRQLLENAEPSGDEGYLRTAKLTHRELSARIGSSRESVSKCMKVLAEKRIVKEGAGHLLVSRDALERLKAGSKLSGK
jgi:CRP-like cAMP-binding protein